MPTPDKANAVLRAGLNLALRDDDPDFPALIFGNYLIGGTTSARLSARVREKEGLSYGTYSSLGAGSLDAVGSFGISSIYAPQNRERVERAIREELERALDRGFTRRRSRGGQERLSGIARRRALAGPRHRRPPLELPVRRPYLRLGHRLREAHPPRSRPPKFVTRCAGAST